MILLKKNKNKNKNKTKKNLMKARGETGGI